MNKHEVRKLYEQRGTPNGLGVDLVPVDRLFQIAADPRFDKAAEAIRRVQGGVPVAVAVIKRQALTKRVRHLDMHAAEQKKAIDLHLRKKQGFLEVI
jgi:hypothetical protein